MRRTSATCAAAVMSSAAIPTRIPTSFATRHPSGCWRSGAPAEAFWPISWASPVVWPRSPAATSRRPCCAQPRWTQVHLFGWKTVMTRALGHECLYLAARDPAGGLVGVLPLVRVRSLAFGHYLVSMPFLNYGGPLGSDAAVQALVARAVELAQRDKAKLLELRSRGPLPLTLPVSHRKVAVVLDLPSGAPETVWQAISPRLKSYVRRTLKGGVSVRFG